MVAYEADQLVSALHLAITSALEKAVTAAKPVPPPSTQLTFEGMFVHGYEKTRSLTDDIRLLWP